MLAFGFIAIDPRSGQVDPAAGSFVVYRRFPDEAVGRISAGTMRWQSIGQSDDAADLALQAASDVEDDHSDLLLSLNRSADEIPLRITHVPDDATVRAVGQQHLLNPNRQIADVTAFLNEVLQDHQTRESGRPSAATAEATLAGTEVTPSVLATTEEFITPGGDPYIPRIIGGHHDVLLIQTALQLGMTVGLVGEPGSGKTTLAQVAAPGLVMLNCHGETTTESVVGQFVPDPTTPSGLSWNDGPLLTAMKAGKVLLVDEVRRAPQDVQATFLSACDHRRSYVDTANPFIGTVTARSGFAVIFTSNPDSGYGMLDALDDRIKFTVEVPTLLSTAEESGAPRKLVHAARMLKLRQAKAKRNGDPDVWVPPLRSLLDSRALASAFGLVFAAQAVLGKCPEPQRDTVQLALAEAMEVDRDALTPLQALP